MTKRVSNSRLRRITVESDGTFAGELVVPAGVPAGTHQLRGTCVSPELPDLGTYVGGEFTVTGEGEDALTPQAAEAQAEAAAQPTAGGIEPYPRYDGQTVCSPSAKPGTATFAQRTLATFTNTGTFGIGRSCNIGGTSEHKEGRAWDWAANASNAAQHRSVDRMLTWLLATDAQGNRHAMARRLGIMYIIWDRQMFRMYRVNDGWQPYHGSSPHTDHVHISFTRAGGNKTTSYWSMRNAPSWGGKSTTQPVPIQPTGPKPASFNQTRRDIDGRYTPLPGDFNGDGRDDVIWFGPGNRRDFLWWGRARGGFDGVQLSIRRSFQPQVGDYDGDGRDDIIWYNPGDGPDFIWWGSANRRFVGQSLSIRGTYTPPITGDFDGDGRDDIFWYGPGQARDWLWWGNSNRRFSGAATAAIGTYTPPFSGDFDGDGRDDIYWYGRGGAPDFIWHGRSDQTFDRSAHRANFAHTPLVGNFNGDRRDDIFWYRAGASADAVWLGDTGRSFHRQGLRNVVGHYPGAFVADLDDNGRDDVYWYAPGAGSDYIWWF